MNGLCWWLVNLVSRALEPDERDAVRGDLCESGESAGQSLLQVLGLVARRQAVLWMKWRPWVALVFLAMPLGLLFGLMCKVIAHSGAIYLWLYTNYWSWTILENAAYRHDFIDFVAATLITYGVLAGLAWSAGLALGFLSRKSLPVSGALFSLLLFFGQFLYAPGAPPRVPPRVSANSVVFEHPFYRVLFPLILQTLLILAPSVLGMLHSRRRFQENHS